MLPPLRSLYLAHLRARTSRALHLAAAPLLAVALVTVSSLALTLAVACMVAGKVAREGV